LLNQVEERVNVCRGDLFAPLGGKAYDVVLFNPPFYRGAPQNSFDYAWRADDTVERFAAGLRDHLKPEGYALVLLSTDGDAPAFLRCFAEEGFGRRVVARRDLTTEILTVHRLAER
jgi:methylase of polypeptide subunit release factors